MPERARDKDTNAEDLQQSRAALCCPSPKVCVFDWTLPLEIGDARGGCYRLSSASMQASRIRRNPKAEHHSRLHRLR
jgi:hypothetical protein